MSKRVSSILILTLTALSLAACGLRGELERPDPLWGNPQDYEQPETSGDADEDGR